MKTNFRKDPDEKIEVNIQSQETKEFTKEEFEEFMIKSGAKGSFMIYRSENKDDELGLEEI
jgi:hypothetical protein|tara:strand:+ start:437 stop:619 length:183 start_codon:yes stop_codon:yes gene_type:complete